MEEFRAGAREQVLESMPPTSREVLLGTAKTGWVPVEHDRHLVHGIVATLGEQGATEMWRQFVGTHVQTPLLRSLVDGATRLLGFTPGTFVWLVSKGWTQVYRDVCTPSIVSRDDHAAVLAFEDIAPEAMAEPGYLICFRATLLGLFEVTRSEGELDWDVDHAARRAVATLRW